MYKKVELPENGFVGIEQQVAEGAVKAAKFMCNKNLEPKLYDMNDIN